MKKNHAFFTFTETGEWNREMLLKYLINGLSCNPLQASISLSPLYDEPIIGIFFKPLPSKYISVIEYVFFVLFIGTVLIDFVIWACLQTRNYVLTATVREVKNWSITFHMWLVLFSRGVGQNGWSSFSGPVTFYSYPCRAWNDFFIVIRNICRRLRFNWFCNLHIFTAAWFPMVFWDDIIRNLCYYSSSINDLLGNVKFSAKPLKFYSDQKRILVTF